MEKITLNGFYKEYNLYEYMSYSTLRNFIYNNYKELEKNGYIKIENKKRIRKTYLVLRPVKIRNLVMNYFHNQELYTTTTDVLLLKKE